MDFIKTFQFHYPDQTFAISGPKKAKSGNFIVLLLRNTDRRTQSEKCLVRVRTRGRENPTQLEKLRFLKHSFESGRQISIFLYINLQMWGSWFPNQETETFFIFIVSSALVCFRTIQTHRNIFFLVCQ